MIEEIKAYLSEYEGDDLINKINEIKLLTHSMSPFKDEPVDCVVTCPSGHTWKSFAELLLSSMPRKTKEHYENKIILFNRWWEERGYPDGIPDEAELNLEMKRDVPSWRRICKALLRNDYWCKGLGFTQHKNEAYQKYLDLMKRRRAEWSKEDAA